MKKETRITAPDGCEVEKVEILDGAAVVTFREKERKLPKSWEDFCEMFPIKKGEEHYFNTNSAILNCVNNSCIRNEHTDKNMLPNLATAEAVLALCQLIQLRNCYNGDWVPDWTENYAKFIISFNNDGTVIKFSTSHLTDILYFKTQGLCDEFLRYFRPLIEKLKPLYGIKEGGGE